MDTRIDNDLFIMILKYLAPNELLIVQECSRRWNFCANSSILWSNHLNELWQPIDDIPQPTLIDKILEEVPLDEIIENLPHNVYYDESQISDELDYFRLCKARLLFRHLKTAQKLYVPTWSFNINLYKASFYFSKYEMCRTSLLVSEVVLPYKWKCYFKHSIEEQYAWDCIFYEDGRLDSSIHEKPMVWRVTI